jgi:hypothetical protein
MIQFAVAFSTTGNSPKAGHRFSEFVLIGQEDGVPNGQRAWFKLNEDTALKYLLPFDEALERMKDMIGDGEVIVHNAGKWRRFMRVERKSIKRHGASHLMKNVIDVHAWAHQRYPRQRNDVVAIAKRAGIEIPAELTGLDLEAELLRRVANLMSTPNKTSPVATEAVPVHPVDNVQVIQHEAKSNWIEKAGNFWRILTGHA